MSLVQSPACEMRIDAVLECGSGMVAKACHSVSGAREKRMVAMYGMFLYGKVRRTSRADMGVAVMGTRRMRSQGRMMSMVVAARSHTAGFRYMGLLPCVWLDTPALTQSTMRAVQPPKRWVRSNMLWNRWRKRGCAATQMRKIETRNE